MELGEGQIDYESIRHLLTEADIRQLFDTIDNSRSASSTDKEIAHRGMVKLVGENRLRIPTDHEIAALSKFFPQEMINAMLEKRTFSRPQAKSKAFSAFLYVLLCYSIAALIWAFALKGRLFWFGLSGALIGMIIGGIFVYPVIAAQRNVNRSKDMMFAATAIWGNFAIVIGIVGIVTWAVRAMFF